MAPRRLNPPLHAAHGLPGARYHAVQEGHISTGCGLPLVVLMPELVAAREVPEARRCQAPGCRVLWPPHLLLIEGGAA